MIKIYSENEWLYPDTIITENLDHKVLHAPIGGSVCCQVLTDMILEKPTEISFCVSHATPVVVTPYQLQEARVERNSGKDLRVAENYEEVQDFVTRKAPFQVFDVTRRIDNDCLSPGRVAFWLRFDIPSDCEATTKKIGLIIRVEDQCFICQFELVIHACAVPTLAQAQFGMINWLDIPNMDRLHGTKTGDSKRDKLLEAYIHNQLDMRNTDLKLPSGTPIRDENGKVIDFDFSEAEWVGNKALQMGFKHILGGFVARFQKWDMPEHYLNWDKSVSVVSLEGFRQLSIYFQRVKECRERNAWGDFYQQCLVDEPQFPNSEHYRILCGMVRKSLGNIVIHDPVESSTLYGSTDIWCVKQAVYEKNIDDFQTLQEMGEPMWLYTCGFPAGYVMNRVMDLPLAATRLPFWMCILYHCVGFLHWGYNFWSNRPFEETCYKQAGKEEMMLPPGNAHIVYPGENGPIDSVRSHLQRMGAEDAELLMQLQQKDSKKAQEIIHLVARTFSDYENNPEKLDEAKLALLNALEG